MAKKKNEIAVVNKVGRPTDYRPEYCEDLVNHLSQGLSFESFAAIVDTCRAVIYDWLEKHEDFKAAKERGTEKSRLFWEKLGVDNIQNQAIAGVGSKSLNQSIWIFNMKNRFPNEWRDKREIVGDVKTGPDLSGLMAEAADDPKLMAALRTVGDALSKKGG